MSNFIYLDDDRKAGWAFVTGYYHGLSSGPASRKEAEELHPTYSNKELDCFCSGSQDGFDKDRFRLGLMQRKLWLIDLTEIAGEADL